MAAKKLPAPSMMKSHRQPGIPRAPSRPEKTPAAIKPENAVARTSPEYKTAVRKANSFRVYQHDRR